MSDMCAADRCAHVGLLRCGSILKAVLESCGFLTGTSLKNVQGPLRSRRPSRQFPQPDTDTLT